MLPHSLVFLFGFAEQLQDVDGPWFCNSIGSSSLCPLWSLSLGKVCFVFHNPAEIQHDLFAPHTQPFFKFKLELLVKLIHTGAEKQKTKIKLIQDRQQLITALSHSYCMNLSSYLPHHQLSDALTVPLVIEPDTVDTHCNKSINIFIYIHTHTRTRTRTHTHTHTHKNHNTWSSDTDNILAPSCKTAWLDLCEAISPKWL